MLFQGRNKNFYYSMAHVWHGGGNVPEIETFRSPPAQIFQSNSCLLPYVVVFTREVQDFDGKMEEDVEPEDEDGVDGRGIYGWDGWVGDLGVVDVSSIFGLIRGSGSFTTVSPTFVLVSKYISRDDVMTIPLPPP